MTAVAPLAGLRVLDLTRLLPGPAATMHLADFGADVIKVEDTGDGDALRRFPPLIGEGEAAFNAVFEAVNRNKRSICLDLKSAAGRDLLLRLVDGADALIEGFRPGTLDRLGLGWPTLHARNPRLVMCAISGYGQDGPLSQSAGHDLNYLALAGVIDQTRSAANPAADPAAPAIPSVQIADILGGTLASLSSLLIALLAAQRSGQGAYVDCAMSEAAFAHHFFAHGALDAGVAPKAAAELLTGGVACYRCYLTADRQWLAVGALELKFWTNFCKAVGLPQLAARHWSLGEAAGTAAANETIAVVDAHLRTQTLAHWMDVLTGADACASPVLSPAAAKVQPQVHARQVVRVDDRGVTHVTPFARIGQWRPELRRAPAQGQHTAEVLHELGLRDDEIATLVRTGVAR